MDNGNKGTVLLAVADEGYPKQVLDIIANIDSDLYRVIIAPYISEQTSRICKDVGVGYVDFAGNCFISFDCLYIDIKGNKNENISKRGLKSIYERTSIVPYIIMKNAAMGRGKAKDAYEQNNALLGEI